MQDVIDFYNLTFLELRMEEPKALVYSFFLV
jgi:hypothetical protein